MIPVQPPFPAPGPVAKSALLRLLVLMLLLAAVPAAAQQNKRDQRCFNEKEAEAEAEVRTGIQLREILRRCAAVDRAAGQAALEAWYSFDQTNGDRLRAAVDLRRQALSRIYRDRTRALQWETDAIAATTKAIQVNDGICKSAYDVVERLTNEGWAGFKHFARLQGNLLDYEIPLCRK